MKQHVLYRIFDGEDLLYVGITDNITNRLLDHQTDKEWWQWNLKVELCFYPNRLALAKAEREAIAAEHPKYNVQHRVEPVKVDVVFVDVGLADETVGAYWVSDAAWIDYCRETEERIQREYEQMCKDDPDWHKNDYRDRPQIDAGNVV